MSVTAENEWKQLSDEFIKIEKNHEEYLKKMREIRKSQDSCLKAVKHQYYMLGQLRDDITKAETSPNASPSERIKSAELRQQALEMRARLYEMQNELPVQNNGFYLNLILGSNLNVSLLTGAERYKYKQEYENFKWKVTILVLSVLLLSYVLPFRVIDSIGNFIMVWYYCTLTIRESILRINGSKIKGWWVLHHYLSCVLCGIHLTWKDGPCYQEFRPQFIMFVAYIGLVQLMQGQYQSGCLRRLHALGQGHQMDITVEGFQSWMFKGLTFLLPFLMLGYIFQLYNAYTMFLLSQRCTGQWQVFALAILFAVIGVGNIWTTTLVILKKLREGTKSDQITRKYRAKNDQKSE
ncbi:unnamed protein product, partial [Mesorhabditis belari]|uniref:Transmembrane protein 120A n=1 Tax=Mesorhabditis belari TaxID=2138241 RepID=A0AAF3E8J9_9BILA